jgi:hypothetical protein
VVGSGLFGQKFKRSIEAWSNRSNPNSEVVWLLVAIYWAMAGILDFLTKIAIAEFPDSLFSLPAAAWFGVKGSSNHAGSANSGLFRGEMDV